MDLSFKYLGRHLYLAKSLAGPSGGTDSVSLKLSLSNMSKNWMKSQRNVIFLSTSGYWSYWLCSVVCVWFESRMNDLDRVSLRDNCSSTLVRSIPLYWMVVATVIFIFISAIHVGLEQVHGFSISSAQQSLVIKYTLANMYWKDYQMQLWMYTPLAVVSYARTAGIAQIPSVSSKEGAVIGAVLSTRKFHRGHHWHQTHMNNCWINEITNKLKQ
jgi:hypothetical protein